jgi:hypothetical protein
MAVSELENTLLFNVDADGETVNEKTRYTEFEKQLVDETLEYVSSFSNPLVFIQS